VTGSRLVEQLGRYGAFGGQCSLTDRVAALQHLYLSGSSFSLTAVTGKERQRLCPQEVAKCFLEEPVSPNLLSHSCATTRCSRKMEPCKALAAIHWDAAKLQ